MHGKMPVGDDMKHIVAVLSEPTDGKLDEFNDYYENLHLDEVLQSTGWESAQRFRLSDQVGLKCPHEFLAIYEADADKPEDVMRVLNETRSQRQQSDALNKKTAAVWVFSETGPRHS
jgi:hypothetical protein